MREYLCTDFALKFPSDSLSRVPSSSGAFWRESARTINFLVSPVYSRHKCGVTCDSCDVGPLKMKFTGANEI